MIISYIFQVVVDVFPESEWRVLDDQVAAHLDEVESITQQIEEGLDLQGSSDKAREEKETFGQVVEIDELSEASERSDDEAGIFCCYVKYYLSKIYDVVLFRRLS